MVTNPRVGQWPLLQWSNPHLSPRLPQGGGGNAIDRCIIVLALATQKCKGNETIPAILKEYPYDMSTLKL